MGNQLTGIAPSQILPVEQYLTDVSSEYEFECSLGSTRFFKVARAKTKEGLVVVKVFVIHDPSLPLKDHRIFMEDIHTRLHGTSNCLPFQKAVQSEKAALLIRQYVKDSLYDRISTRPFLINIEKRWLAFQLLCALNQCHKMKVYHGDIKSENVMVTGWTWLLLSDFASFKPVYLPEDNPSDFSYFFDTSRRRTCYVAPERFVEGGWKTAEVGGQTANLDITDSSDVKKGELTPAMDIFSAGCVITELFTEGTPPFDLSQLLAYINGEYSPWKVLEKIDDGSIRDLIRHMIKKEPNHRLSAEEYMIQQRGKAFPEYFFSFLKLYLQRFATAPILPPDDRIIRLKKDFSKITKNLCVKEDHCEENVGLVLVLSLLESSSRKLHFFNTKIMALQLLLDFSKYLTTDIILDRIVPYMLHFANDHFPRVRAELVRVITQCLKTIKSVPRSDANIFPEYIFPSLSNLTQDPSAMVRAAYAENIAQLAETGLKVLEMMQRSDLEEKEEEETDSTIFQASYDMELLSLQETIQQKVVTLLSDPDNMVKQALMENGITRLCVFFGRQKANDVLLSHMITFLNDKTDWKLRGSFFDNIVGVAAYVGWQSSPVLKPLLEQGLNDTEEFVVYRTLRTLQSLTELGLLPKTMLHEFLQEVVPFLAHSGIWIRQGAVGFISAVAKTFNIADIHCKLLPLVQVFLNKSVLQINKEVYLLNALEGSVPRKVFDYILKSNLLGRLFDTLQERQYMRKVYRNKVTYSEMDESMSQIFRKLSSLGMAEEHEDKVLAMKDYIIKLHRIRAGSSENEPRNGEEMNRPGEINVISVRAVTRRHAELERSKDSKMDGSTGTPPSRGKKKQQTLDSQTSSSMNPEWKSMFGSSDSSSATDSPKSKSIVKAELQEKKISSSTTSLTSQGSSNSGSFVTMSQGQISIPEGTLARGTIGAITQDMNKIMATRYNPCKLELRNLVHQQRDRYNDEILSKDLLIDDLSPWESQPPLSNWRPKGLLVAHLHEHRGSINRIQVSCDHSYFATASNDGSIKLWECDKLEGKSSINRSKQTINLKDGKINSLVFCEGSLSLAAATENNNIHVYKIESGKANAVNKLEIDKEEFGKVVDVTHYDTGAQSVLAYATVNGYIMGFDLRSNKEVWKLKNDPKKGLITTCAVHHSQCWFAVGTSSGSHVCWDLRFQLPITSIEHPMGARVRKLIVHPKEQSWIISATQGNNEVSMWDVETGARRKALWASPAPPLSQKQASNHSVYGMHMVMTDNNVIMLTASSDMRARFWDINYPANSYIMAPAAMDPGHQPSVSYRSRLIEGTEVIIETYTKKQTLTNEDIPRCGPDTPAIGHHDVISDINTCMASQCLVITGSRDGVVKVWK
ncbi:phosphoinositide 3-kinase regulatory subunit 4-like isoform X1 [Mytilus galloprovincialis]|uniref:phosphoinositide 3-kinase regulatory subunit 4-like isoform X1 n=1 Tax=Mytilus galloprovincialis TaxID=29158 RepID=UPI003F7C0726